MSSFNFYYFKDLTHKQQPYLSNWCWAACLSSLIDGLQTTTNIGNRQCDLASFYKKLTKNPQVHIQNYNDCCPYNKNSSDCNKGIADDDIPTVYKNSGIEALEENNLMVNNYSWVKQTLIDNQAPILVKFRLNGQAHANLIIGYGEINTCEYLLLSDPQNKTADEYKLMSMVVNMSIEKIWVLEKLNTTELEKDAEIYDRFEKASTFTNNLNTQKFNRFDEQELKNPLNYIGYKYPALIDEFLNNPLRTKSLNENFLKSLTGDFRNQKHNNVCQRKITKKPTEKGNIIGLTLDDLDTPTTQIKDLLNNDSLDCRLYLNEYAIEAIVSIEKDFNELFIVEQLGHTTNGQQRFSTNVFQNSNPEERIKIQIIHSPQNYNLNSNPQGLEQFKASLSRLPKVQHFADDNDSPLLA